MDKNELTLSATHIRYLLGIHFLSQGREAIKCTDIADLLNVTRPSVHSMIKTLSALDIITKPHYGKVNFTEDGKALARDYAAFYVVLSAHFRLLFPEETTDISEAVCAFMSQMSYPQLKKFCTPSANHPPFKIKK